MDRPLWRQESVAKDERDVSLVTTNTIGGVHSKKCSIYSKHFDGEIHISPQDTHATT